jgi:hypothetical protein
MEAPKITINASATGANDGDRVIVASLRPRFRTCAMRGLARDPTEQGKLEMSATIDASGTVTAASITTNAGLAADTAACMVTAVRTKAFAAGAPRTIQLHIQTVKEN